MIDETVVFAGEGAAKVGDYYDMQETWSISPDAKTLASGILPTLLEKYEAKDFLHTIDFEPFYLKDFVVLKKKKKA